MLVKGTQTISVNVDVEPKELFHGLCQHAGLGPVFQASSNTLWKETLDNKNKLILLEEYRDISYHGSPCYQSTGQKITDPKTLEIYIHLEELRKLLSL